MKKKQKSIKLTQKDVGGKSKAPKKNFMYKATGGRMK
jgi:hypothetical protein